MIYPSSFLCWLCCYPTIRILVLLPNYSIYCIWLVYLLQSIAILSMASSLLGSACEWGLVWGTDHCYSSTSTPEHSFML